VSRKRVQGLIIIHLLISVPLLTLQNQNMTIKEYMTSKLHKSMSKFLTLNTHITEKLN